MSTLDRAPEPQILIDFRDEQAKRLEEFVERVTFRPDRYRFRIGTTKWMKYPFLQVQCYRPDTFTGEMEWGSGGKAYISEFATNSEIFQTMLGLAKGYDEHEVRESFLVDGKRPYGPHIDVEMLIAVSERYDARPLMTKGAP